MNPDKQAAAFLEAINIKIAHGDDEHKRWLASELAAWVKPLQRILEETHQHGVAVGKRFTGG